MKCCLAWALFSADFRDGILATPTFVLHKHFLPMIHFLSSALPNFSSDLVASVPAGHLFLVSGCRQHLLCSFRNFTAECKGSVSAFLLRPAGSLTPFHILSWDSAFLFEF